MRKPYLNGDAQIIQDTFWDIVEEKMDNIILIKLTIPICITLERDFGH